MHVNIRVSPWVHGSMYQMFMHGKRFFDIYMNMVKQYAAHFIDRRRAHLSKIYQITSGPEVIKFFFILNSTEHEISTAYKTRIQTNKEVSCFKSLRCCILPAHKC